MSDQGPGLNYFYDFTCLGGLCLDCGALINVDAPGCGTSVVRGPTGHK